MEWGKNDFLGLPRFALGIPVACSGVAWMEHSLLESRTTIEGVQLLWSCHAEEAQVSMPGESLS